MVNDGLIYIYYGGFGMSDGKLVKVTEMKKMETHLFLTTAVDFKEPASVAKPGDTEFFNRLVDGARTECILLGSYRHDLYFLSRFFT